MSLVTLSQMALKELEENDRKIEELLTERTILMKGIALQAGVSAENLAINFKNKCLERIVEVEGEVETVVKDVEETGKKLFQTMGG